MPRYIDADLLFKSINKLVPCDYGSIDSYEAHEAARDVICDVLDLLDDTSTADVQEVKHGHWVNETYCSVCGRFPVDTSESISNRRLTKFFDWCPHCGAKMDGGEGDDG